MDPRVASLVRDVMIVRTLGLPGPAIVMAKVASTDNLGQPEEAPGGGEMHGGHQCSVEHVDMGGRGIPTIGGARGQRDGACFAKWVAQAVVKMSEQEAGNRGCESACTAKVTKLCRNKKLPSGALEARTVEPMHAVKGSRNPVHKKMQRQEASPEIRASGWPREVEIDVLEVGVQGATTPT